MKIRRENLKYMNILSFIEEYTKIRDINDNIINLNFSKYFNDNNDNKS